jgi:stage II sporulation protein D
MIAADGMRSKRIVIGARSVVTLATAKRWRRVRGPVTITGVDGALIITARMGLASYLTATLAAEAQSNDPAAYLTALAVVQRNFVQMHRGRHAPYADVCDNTHCQVADPGTMPRIFERAVTRSLRIALGSGSMLPCYYCGACGGGTLRPEQVWRRAEPGYTNVSCDNCRGSRWYRWRQSVPATAEVIRLIMEARRPPFIDDDFKIAMGRIAGFAAAPGNSIESIERRGPVYILTGRGFGHRIGLCQAGARTLARRGRSAEAILRYYFPGVTVARDAQIRSPQREP